MDSNCLPRNVCDSVPSDCRLRLGQGFCWVITNVYRLGEQIGDLGNWWFAAAAKDNCVPLRGSRRVLGFFGLHNIKLVTQITQPIQLGVHPLSPISSWSHPPLQPVCLRHLNYILLFATASWRLLWCALWWNCTHCKGMTSHHRGMAWATNPRACIHHSPYVCTYK